MDAFGNPLEIGDEVVYGAMYSGGLHMGTVLRVTPKGATIQRYPLENRQELPYARRSKHIYKVPK
jgi:ferredoxin-fold anticodon binding domain-containing protein